MSSTSDNGSCSPSPSTPEPLTDEHAPFTSVDLSAWCHSFSPITDIAPWSTQDSLDSKFSSNNLLMLSDVQQQDKQSPFESQSPESPVAINPAVFQLSQPSFEASTSSMAPVVFNSYTSECSSSESAAVSDIIARSAPPTAAPVISKPVPPPPVQTRRIDVPAPTRVIYPPRESCHDLMILTPSIPSSGTKSRVETQVRVTLDLAQASGSGDHSSYDRVGSWKWIKLPKGTATRKRSRKEGKIDAAASDTLFLSANVSCSSNPSKEVTSCATCQGREAKRVARKIAARIRPARSDSESGDGPSNGEEASSSIIQFNCPDTLDFSSGSVVLPLRITCYCRHHREKVGFNVHFQMCDSTGRVVGRGMSPPIMITDDHKSTGVNAPKRTVAVAPQPSEQTDIDWEAGPSNVGNMDNSTVAPSKRRLSKDNVITQTKRRAKPYDATSTRPTIRSRKNDTSAGNAYPNVASPTGNPYPDASALSQYASSSSSVYTGTAPSSPQMLDEMVASLPSPPNSYGSPTSPTRSYFDNHPDSMMFDMQQRNYFPVSPPDTAPSTPPVTHNIASPLDTSLVDLTAFGFAPQVSDSPFSSPKIHRLIPSSGPTFGGVEVTVLGQNFQPSAQYSCLFGDVLASSTTRWSDNTLVCLLPPRACAGVVPVSLEGFKTEEIPEPEPVLFTYTDESDRSLMELALQVVGLKMTGKIEEVRDIAMRIVGATAQDTTQMLNMSSSGSTNFEQQVINALSALDGLTSCENARSVRSIISHQSATGQTLLHLACFGDYPDLVHFLIEREIELNVRDKNGCTAMHFAALSGSQACAGRLVDAGADMAVVDALGRTPVQIASAGFFRPLLTKLRIGSQADEESQWGDGEESEAEEKCTFNSHVSRPTRRTPSQLSNKTASLPADESQVDPEAAVDDDDNATIVAPESLPSTSFSGKNKTDIDEKAAAPIAEYFQRAWAQFQSQQLVPNMPNMPQLPNMPGWVYPVFVPISAWPPFRTEKRNSEDESDKDKSYDTTVEPRSPTSEWRAAWEKFIVNANGNKLPFTRVPAKGKGKCDKPITDEMLSEVDGSASGEGGKDGVIAVKAPVTSRSLLRRFGYRSSEESVPRVKAIELAKQPESSVTVIKKEDRMLMYFWIPILILASIWALTTSRPSMWAALDRLVSLLDGRINAN